MMKRMARLTGAVLILFFAALYARSQSLPPINSKTLNDTQVALPNAGGSQPLILVVGFSHKSSESCGPWGKRLAADFHANPKVAYYQIPVLQDAPSFVRGFILRGMRKDVPAAEQPHYIPVYDHEADWKKLVGFSGPDDAYVIVADPQGHVVWQTHGAMNDASYGEMKAAVDKVMASSPAGAATTAKP
jgi:hypothetical protein